MVPLPSKRKLMQCKWFYRIKVSIDVLDVKYNVRLVSKSYSQFQGVDYSEKFSPVAMMDSIMLVLAIVVSKHWEVHHMDVKSAFLHGDAET